MKKVYPERSERGLPRAKRGGFTLIELLVVMAIIGILSGIFVINYQGYLKTARDGKRKTDLEQIRSALEMYRADYSKYLISIPGLFSGDSICCSPGTSIAYILIPNDPLTGLRYIYKSADGVSYSLCASLERGGGTVSANCAGATTCGVACNYEVTNP